MSTETQPKTELPQSLDHAATMQLAPILDTPLQRLDKVKRMMQDGTLIKDEDYGIIPGVGKKPTLLKPGAQKICAVFYLAPIVKSSKPAFKENFIVYEVQMQVVSKQTGIIEGEGLGVCSSLERKYKNQGMHDVANTLAKMAAKRALIDATISATGLSSILTQDIEDMVLDEEKRPSPAAPPERAAPPKAEFVPASSEAIAAYKQRRSFALEHDIEKAGFPVPPELKENPSASLVAKWTGNLEEILDKYEAQLAPAEVAA